MRGQRSALDEASSAARQRPLGSPGRSGSSCDRTFRVPTRTKRRAGDATRHRKNANRAEARAGRAVRLRRVRRLGVHVHGAPPGRAPQPVRRARRHTGAHPAVANQDGYATAGSNPGRAEPRPPSAGAGSAPSASTPSARPGLLLTRLSLTMDRPAAGEQLVGARAARAGARAQPRARADPVLHRRAEPRARRRALRRARARGLRHARAGQLQGGPLPVLHSEP